MLDVDPVVVGGRWFRHTPAGADPARRPEPPADSRWQRGAVVDALYLADDERCVWAEWYRALAEAAVPPQAALPRDLWCHDLASSVVADLSTRARLGRVGLAPPHPGRRDWPGCQAVGEQLWREGWRGLLAPSAARPSNTVLVIFLIDALVPGELVAVGSTRVSEPPAPPVGMRT